MTEQVYGMIELPEKIDISDPSYDEDVWCRINNFPIQPGIYECYTLTANNRESGGWGKRIARIGIRMPDVEIQHRQRVGIVGVDSGMAGFFNCDNRLAFEDAVNNPEQDVFLSDKSFFSSSGYGDGAYEVYTGYSEGKAAEVYIEFIGQEK